MKNLLCVFAFLLMLLGTQAQSSRFRAEKYPSLLWEISGRGLAKPSYLFGTMHVSSKMVFNLSDSFYRALQQVQVVALETNPGTWQADFSRYDLSGEGLRSNGSQPVEPEDYLTINSLKQQPFVKGLEAALSANPAIINTFLYRSNLERSGDFEEDTYLDLHIYQAGKKMGKKICGLEDFDGSMQLVKEAYADAAKEKKQPRTYGYDEEFSYSRMEEAYRTGNLDLLDTINKVNSQSAAFDEKFLYRRNEIQAASIDSVLKTGARLFACVGAAHLPGNRGVIELLRQNGYWLRPVRLTLRKGHFKDFLEKKRMPVTFSKQVSRDSFYTVAVPGKLYDFGKAGSNRIVHQFADMVNGSFYMVTRYATQAAILGLSEAQVLHLLDSVLYESIPGKILSKKVIVRNGYRGFEIVNRTRRGDIQRSAIFVTPFEVILFKMSGTGNYVLEGPEARQFFNSIQLRQPKTAWAKWQPATGGFEVELPHTPLLFQNENLVYAAYDAEKKTAFQILRTDIHNYGFLEADSFDLGLMEESFAASENIGRNLLQQRLTLQGYPALDARYKGKDSSVTWVRFILQGPHYYTLVTTAAAENKAMQRFLQSFALRAFSYGKALPQTDTLLKFRVQSPVAVVKKTKLPFYPDGSLETGSQDEDDQFLDEGTYESRVVDCPETGEKIYLSYTRPSAYFFREKGRGGDSVADQTDWFLRWRKSDTLSNGLVVTDYTLGKPQSSRMLRGHSVLKNGFGYRMETQLDTLSEQSAFIRQFFESFRPLDSLQDVTPYQKKTAVFFAQFFSSDTFLHKKAVINLPQLEVDSSDLPLLQQCVSRLSWKEKNYLQLKRSFIEKLAGVKSRAAADYLKEVYYRAGDTLEWQYAALEALVNQQTTYSFSVFAQLMQTDPPVLNVNEGRVEAGYRSWQRHRLVADRPLLSTRLADGAFLDNLMDSLPLTAGIVHALLPLIHLHDYELPVMQLLAVLVDSGLVRAADYQAYLPKFLPEARQLLKKQAIREKAKAMEAVQNTGDEDARDSDSEAAEEGNDQLSLYATLLLPFYDTNSQVAPLIQQLLQSNDRRLKYTTAVLLLRKGYTVPDTVLQEFAALDDYRYQLYTELAKLKQEAIFPARYKSQLLLARSRLVSLQLYGRPDTVVFLQKLPVRYKEVDGELYFFKFRQIKEGNHWKLAAAGLFPQDSTQLLFSAAVLNTETGKELNFTTLGSTRMQADLTEKEQMEMLRKKLLYSRRRSAEFFYAEDRRYGPLEFLQMR